MKTLAKISLAVVAMGAVGAFAAGETSGSVADKPEGFRFFGQHLTIKPYVSLSYSYDSNVDTTKHSADDNIFLVEPGVDFIWRADNWSLTGTLFYRYNYYCEYSDTMDENSYGESLRYAWTTSSADSRGWSLLLSERYAFISQSDDLGSKDGRGIWRDREHFDAAGALERRFTDRWHADVSGQYDWIDYHNDSTKYAPLYGWSEWAGGLEAGYTLSPWTDFLIAGGYSHYLQKGSEGYDAHYSNESESWSVQGGLGSRATEKISYRALVGASWLNYGGHSGTDSGWTYSLSGNWRVSRQFQVSMIGSSYYQPDERYLGSASKVYTLSAGCSYLTFGDRVTFTANVAYRHNQNVFNDYSAGGGDGEDEDTVAYRLGATYTLNRWMSFFGHISYEDEFCDNKDWEYDRFRGTLGVRFHY